ncbi:unnamed protein product [Porites evermanni]|uniref:Uncharacterized protein n=1 Tax=Porites evermanni TaxID=104178 RepID=A0ABN8LXM7_9CNID|nr:unnamed protein product [Porites evermanni]
MDWPNNLRRTQGKTVVRPPSTAEEREECNTRRCILRMLQGNETIVQAEYKLVVRWEHESMRDHNQGVASFHASRMRRFRMQLCSILRLSRPWEKETPTADLVFESDTSLYQCPLQTRSTESRSIFQQKTRMSR